MVQSTNPDIQASLDAHPDAADLIDQAALAKAEELAESDPTKLPEIKAALDATLGKIDEEIGGKLDPPHRAPALAGEFTQAIDALVGEGDDIFTAEHAEELQRLTDDSASRYKQMSELQDGYQGRATEIRHLEQRKRLDVIANADTAELAVALESNFGKSPESYLPEPAPVGMLGKLRGEETPEAPDMSNFWTQMAEELKSRAKAWADGEENFHYDYHISTSLIDAMNREFGTTMDYDRAPWDEPQEAAPLKTVIRSFAGEVEAEERVEIFTAEDEAKLQRLIEEEAERSRQMRELQDGSQSRAGSVRHLQQRQRLEVIAEADTTELAAALEQSFGQSPESYLPEPPKIGLLGRLKGVEPPAAPDMSNFWTRMAEMVKAGARGHAKHENFHYASSIAVGVINRMNEEFGTTMDYDHHAHDDARESAPLEAVINSFGS